jgi:hypothetical protein
MGAEQQLDGGGVEGPETAQGTRLVAARTSRE